VETTTVFKFFIVLGIPPTNTEGGIPLLLNNENGENQENRHPVHYCYISKVDNQQNYIVV